MCGPMRRGLGVLSHISKMLFPKGSAFLLYLLFDCQCEELSLVGIFQYVGLLFGLAVLLFVSVSEARGWREVEAWG